MSSSESTAVTAPPTSTTAAGPIAATIPGNVIERARRSPSSVALRRFRLGVWQETTWGALRDEAAAIGSALTGLGVGTGDVVGIVADNSREWLAIEIGVQGLGAAPLAVLPDMAPETTRRVIAASRAKVVVVGDQEQFDKLDEARAETPSVTNVVVLDTRGIRELDTRSADASASSDTVTMAALLARRSSVTVDWQQRAGALDEHATALIITRIEGSEVVLDRLSHRELLAAGRAASDALRMHPADVVLSQRSFADAAEQVISVAAAFAAGVSIHIGEDGNDARSTREVQPTLLHADSSWLETVAAQVERSAAGSRGIKKLALARGLHSAPPPQAVRVGRVPAWTRLTGVLTAVAVLVWLLLTPHGNDPLRIGISLLLALAGGFALILSGNAVVTPLRRMLGLRRCRAVVLSGRGASDRALKLLGGLGVAVVPLRPPSADEVARVRSEVLA